MSISKITLEDMLLCRERRAAKQRELIERHGLPVACFTMNIPGEIKYSTLIEFAFLEGVKRFEAALPQTRTREITTSFTGCEAFFVFDEKAESIKAAAVSVEESDEVARLFDIDVIDVTGEKLSRRVERRCIVCGGPVTACARSRAHGLTELEARTNALLCGFAAKKLAELARNALVTEVNATPKPGLVDRRNAGAHRDMDIKSFYRSAKAIEPYFEQMAFAALTSCGASPEALMTELRAVGLEAERVMFSATGFVNTHKGAIFSMGLLLAGAGVFLQTGQPALQTVSSLVSLGIEDALRIAKETPTTNGERVFAKTGALGARGEAAMGFPTAFSAYQALCEFTAQGYSSEDAAALTLPIVMETLADTNLIHRGGEEGLAFARRSAAEINALPVSERTDALRLLDDVFIERNLSPGGCADVLSLALLLRELAGLIEL